MGQYLFQLCHKGSGGRRHASNDEQITMTRHRTGRRVGLAEKLYLSINSLRQENGEWPQRFFMIRGDGVNSREACGFEHPIPSAGRFHGPPDTAFLLTDPPAFEPAKDKPSGKDICVRPLQK